MVSLGCFFAKLLMRSYLPGHALQVATYIDQCRVVCAAADTEGNGSGAEEEDEEEEDDFASANSDGEDE